MADSTNYSIELLRVCDRQLVEAQLSSLTDKHLQDFEQYWKPRLTASGEGDEDWDWERKHRIYGKLPGVEAYAIECEQITQGLMLLETLGHRSGIMPGRRIVYVRSLATAPWNRPSIENPPSYRLVGSTLLEFARYRSNELGYGGLVGLHALPGAEEFYRRLGMLDGGADPEQGTLVYFEWYQQQLLLRDEGEDSID
jgi:hypothetical protein